MFPRATQTRQFTQRPSLGWGVFVLAAVIYAGPSLWMLRNYVQAPYDLAIYDQTLWLIWNGESFNTIIASHVFGVHFSPILVLLSPLSAIPGGAAPEIVAQSLLIASGVFPAAKLAAAANRSRIWFVVLYALHPAIVGGSWFGVRGWNLAVGPLMWAIYLIWKRPTPLRVTILGLAALLFREDLALWVGLVLVILVLAKKVEWRALLTPGMVLGAATAMLLLVISPILSPTGDYFFTSIGGEGAVSVGTHVRFLLYRVAFLIVPLSLSLIGLNWRLLLPLFLPLLGLAWKGEGALTTFYHYEMMFVPLLLLIVALSPKARLKLVPTVIACLAMLVTLGALRPISPIAGSNPFKVDHETTQYADDVIATVVSLDESGSSSIAAPPRLVPHLSERPNIFLFPSPVDQHAGSAAPFPFKDIVVFDCPAPNIVIVDESETVDTWPELLQSHYRLVDDSGQYQVWMANNPVGNAPCSADWRING